MRARRITILSACWSALAFLGCEQSGDSLSRALWNRVLEGKGAVVNFEDVTRFAWDRVYVFAPYTSPRIADRIEGLSREALARTGIDMSDSFVLLVFMNRSKAVRLVKHPRFRGDLSRVARGAPYPRASARFRVHVENARAVLLPF